MVDDCGMKTDTVEYRLCRCLKAPHEALEHTGMDQWNHVAVSVAASS
jgi:hypothetical protein